jgi:hypothetical protein
MTKYISKFIRGTREVMDVIKTTKPLEAILLGVTISLLPLISGIKGCAYRDGDPLTKKNNAVTICPQVVHIAEVEEKMQAMDNSKYLLAEYESMADQRRDLQREYNSFMSNPANKAVYRQYAHPEDVKIPDKLSINQMKYGLGASALILALTGGFAYWAWRKQK